MIKDLKLMWKIDRGKETFKLIGIMFLFSIFMTTIGLNMTKSNLVFIFYLCPIVMFCVPFFSFYRPMFREVEREVELEQKYIFVYSRFINKR